MAEQIRLGIIGIGNMGSEHCRTLLAGKVPELRLAAVADRRSSRRDWARETLPPDTAIFDDGDALLDAGLCDAVLIATPHYQHPTLAMHAFERGLHVLSEKPIGVYPSIVREELAAAERSGRTFALMFNQRTNCVYRALYALIRSGELGPLQRVNWTITDWYRTQHYYNSAGWRATWAGEGGGLLLNQCPHQLDLLQWLFGMPSAVRAFCHVGKWHDIEVEDDLTAYLEFPGGATGVFIASTGDLCGVNRLEATFDRGRIQCDGQTLRFWRSPVSEREYCHSSKNAYSHMPPVEEPVELDGRNEQHTGVLKAFAAHLLRGEPLVAEGAEGLNSLLLANAMYLSAWTDQLTAIPFDEAFYLRLLNERRAASRLKDDPDITFATDHSAGGRIIT